MILFRPVGLEELRLVYQAGMKAFPPRLPDQPIFYPVTNEGYAAQIAKDWNTKSGTLAGFVTRFRVEDGYVAKFERRVVGAREHEELWVPAEELAELNGRIAGQIEVRSAYFGHGFEGHVPEHFVLAGKNARDQLLALARTLPESGFDLGAEIAANHTAIFLNFYFWEQTDFGGQGLDRTARDEVIEALRSRWATTEHGSTPLGVVVDDTVT